MEHPTCVHAVTTKYDKSLKLNRNKYLFMEIVFVSCHVSIKKKSALRGILEEVATKFRKPASRLHSLVLLLILPYGTYRPLRN